MTPIGFVRGGRIDPRDDGWNAETCVIALDPQRFSAEALAGLREFSHVEVVYQFHRVAETEVGSTARRPRGRADWPAVGIFAQRGRVRPNRIGVTVCRVLDVDGRDVHVGGLDAIDATPVLDLKPYLSGFAPRGTVVEPAWATEIMERYW